MKKVYIQPSIEFEFIETSDILVSSWNTKGNYFTGDNKPDIDGELGGETEENFGEAKQSTFIWDDEF